MIRQCGSQVPHYKHSYEIEGRAFYVCWGLPEGMPDEQQCPRDSHCVKKPHHRGACYVRPNGLPEVLPPDIAGLIRPHVPNEFGWCGKCKRKVDPAMHIASIIRDSLK